MLAKRCQAFHFQPSATQHPIEVFLDLVCPFSKRMFNTLVDAKIPFVFRPQVQPWHPQSALLHYALIAVHQQQPEALFKATQLLYDNQDAFLDKAVFPLSSEAIYDRICAIFSDNAIAINKDVFYDGSLAADLKYHIKYARQNAIHVSPTVLVDGLVDNQPSSSWTVEQWQSYV